MTPIPPAPPPAPDPAARPPGESPAAEALRLRRADRARQALVSPWSPTQARRARAIAMALLVLGPMVGALFALVLVPAEPSDVVTADPDRPAVLNIDATVRSIDPGAGEMMVRLAISPTPEAELLPTDEAPENDDDAAAGTGAADAGRSADEDEEPGPLFAEGGVLVDPINLSVNDATGQNLHSLPAGQVPGSLNVVVPLTDSRVTRYPVDRYRSTIFIVARRGRADGAAIPLRLNLRSNDSLFSATMSADRSAETASVIDLRVHRRWTVIGWATFFALLCWMLAISASSIGWMSIVHGVASPFWCWGFLVGVLFALPTLRTALPGNPPGGSLVDLAAFYWAIGIVTLTLVAMVGSWNLRVRRQPHNPDAPRP